MLEDHREVGNTNNIQEGKQVGRPDWKVFDYDYIRDDDDDDDDNDDKKETEICC